MKITDPTRRELANRRFARQAIMDGFERVYENGDPLWKLYRGSWTRERIEEVRIAPNGRELWIKGTWGDARLHGH